MRWFEGSIANAVQTSKTNNAIFVVYVEGKDDNSKKMSDMINNEDVSRKLESKEFVAIKLDSGSEAYTQFVQIYQLVPVPSLFFIGGNGTPIEIIPQHLDNHTVLSKIDSILISSGYKQISIDKPSTSQVKDIKNETASLIQKESEQPKPSIDSPTTSAEKMESLKETPTEIQENVKTETENMQDEAADISKEEKVERARQLIEQKREAKRREEEETERRKEIERRQVGKDVQKMRKQQYDQEFKQVQEERKREKLEEQAARQKILAQIEQDKAERAQRFKTATAPVAPAPVTTAPRNVSPEPERQFNTARLQFRLPDGSSHTHDFQSSDTLCQIREFVRANLNLPYRNFSMSTTFPRRQFTIEDDGRTLQELQLVPNAVILILPAAANTVAQGSSHGGLYGILWMVITPFLNVFSYIGQFLGFGGGSNRGNKRPPQAEEQSTDETAGPTTTKRRVGETTVIRRQGNIHRLSDKKDGDDENNTWNGNSTQQM